MGVQQEEAILDVKINGVAASASINQLKLQIDNLTTALEKMRKEDNPALYEARRQQLIAVNSL